MTVSSLAPRRFSVSASQAESLTTGEKLLLIFRDNVSTATEVTDISGRGVGMSAVRAEVEGLGGEVRIKSRIGQGTRIDMVVPKKSDLRSGEIAMHSEAAADRRAS